MKNLLKGFICLCISCICIKTNAQTPPVREPDMNRPSLFQNLPDKISFRVSDLIDLLDWETGRNVSIALASNFSFQGVISSTSTMSANKLQSIVIRSTNFPGAALSFSKITKDDGSVSYVGRIISFQHGDAYEISEEKGQYYFVKKGFYDLVNE